MRGNAPVWITRARPGATATAERVRALGFEALIDPLLSVEPLDVTLDLRPFAAVAFTSANGVEAFARMTEERGLPVFAVGDATAEAARERGFAAVSSAKGDVENLCALIAADAPGPVLWARARTPAGDLVRQLRARGVSAAGVAVYQTVERVPADATLGRLGGPMIVLLHSPRAARALAAILRDRPLAVPRCLCLSEAVADPLRDVLASASVTFAPRPEESALLDLLTA